MSAAERTFETFHFGDNVMELAGGLIPQIADRVHVDPIDLGELVKTLGQAKELRTNPQINLEIEEVADFVERSGVQNALNRSLWTPELNADDVSRVVMTGAVANWQDRTAQLLVDRIGHITNEKGSLAFLPMGNRLMGTPSELQNPNVQHYQQNHDDQVPTEYQYSRWYVAEALQKAGYDIDSKSYDTGNGDEIASRFANEYQGMLDEPIAFARVANAGVQLALQFRKAAQSINPDFDNQNSPQVFILTDSFPIARTEEQVANPREFQSPYTAIRQVALTAKLLQEAQDAPLYIR